MSLLDRLDVPDAQSCASTSPTDRPRVAASRAVPAPVMPPPTTSTSSGSPSQAGHVTVRCQAGGYADLVSSPRSLGVRQLEQCPDVQGQAAAEPGRRAAQRLAAPSHLAGTSQGTGRRERPERWHEFVGALDQGTSSTRFIVFDHDGNEVARHQLEHAPDPAPPRMGRARPAGDPRRGRYRRCRRPVRGRACPVRPGRHRR